MPWRPGRGGVPGRARRPTFDGDRRPRTRRAAFPWRRAAANAARGPAPDARTRQGRRDAAGTTRRRVEPRGRCAQDATADRTRGAGTAAHVVFETAAAGTLRDRETGADRRAPLSNRAAGMRRARRGGESSLAGAARRTPRPIALPAPERRRMSSSRRRRPARSGIARPERMIQRRSRPGRPGCGGHAAASDRAYPSRDRECRSRHDRPHPGGGRGPTRGSRRSASEAPRAAAPTRPIRPDGGERRHALIRNPLRFRLATKRFGPPAFRPDPYAAAQPSPPSRAASASAMR